MGRRALEVADILRDHGPAWREANHGHVSLGQLEVMSAIERCRTAALGGHVMRCENDACAYTAIAYNSCRNRHCPKCQGAAARQWMAARAAELLPVPYFHIVFTLPAPIGDLAYQNKAVIYDLLFRASAETMVTIAADPKHLGASIGITAVLHTWGSAMTHHPHVQLDHQAARLLAARARAVEAVPQADDRQAHGRACRRPVDVPRRARRPRQHQGVHRLSGAAQADAVVRLCQTPARRARGGALLSVAHTHRVAVSNRRLIAADARTVTFKVKDYRINGPGRYKTMTLDAHEFIRRFLIHVLPKGFHRIRHYGLLASGVKADNLALARRLLAIAPPAPEPEDTGCEPPTALKPCPCCGSAMRIIEVLEAGEPARYRSTTMPAVIRIDTS
jgi:hypothetical protein